VRCQTRHYSGHYELAAVMLDAGADPNAAAQRWTALHQITWVRKPGRGDNDPAPEGSGHLSSLDLVRQLVAHGANVNARMTKKANVGRTTLNMIGATAFLMAARGADAPLMLLLASLGADPLLPTTRLHSWWRRELVLILQERILGQKAK